MPGPHLREIIGGNIYPQVMMKFYAPIIDGNIFPQAMMKFLFLAHTQKKLYSGTFTPGYDEILSLARA